MLGFLLTLAFGFWLSRKGRPYNGLLFNVHKLIALGTVILAAMGLYQLLGTLDVNTLIVIMLVLAALSVVALFLSGAFMSAEKGEYRVMKLIHNIGPFVVVIAMGYTVYLL
jgi:hypothetical protein